MVCTMTYGEMLYDGDGEATASLRPAVAEPELEYPSGVRVHHLAVGAGTGGAFGLYRWDFSPARTGPDPHFHRTMSESFFVLSGVVSLHDGRSWREAGPGDYLYVPPGGVHGFRNDSGEAASMLLLFAPGAPREEYFHRLAHLAEDPLTGEDRAAFMRHHDTYWI